MHFPTKQPCTMYCVQCCFAKREKLPQPWVLTGISYKIWSVRHAWSTWHHQLKYAKTDTTSVAAAKHVFKTVRLVEESLLTSEILLWRSVQLARYIRARTGKLSVKRPCQLVTKLTISLSVCIRAQNSHLQNYHELIALRLAFCVE